MGRQLRSGRPRNLGPIAAAQLGSGLPLQRIAGSAVSPDLHGACVDSELRCTAATTTPKVATAPPQVSTLSREPAAVGANAHTSAAAGDAAVGCTVVLRNLVDCAKEGVGLSLMVDVREECSKYARHRPTVQTRTKSTREATCMLEPQARSRRGYSRHASPRRRGAMLSAAGGRGARSQYRRANRNRCCCGIW